jgi:hypothetical protein
MHKRGGTRDETLVVDDVNGIFHSMNAFAANGKVLKIEP